uniref:TNT domain-containing protein n=1 Tax=Flavobacterium daejeonense TaxID=350893 RepID=UPI00068B2EA5
IKPNGVVENGNPEIKTDAKLPSTTQTSTAPTTQAKTTGKVTFTKNIDGNGYKVEGLELQNYYPPNNGAMQGTTNSEYLLKGTQISRIGSETGRYASPIGTPMELRALPPGNTGIESLYEVVKPIPVQSSTIAPAFFKPGTGTQYLLPKSIDILLKRGIIAPIK